MRRLTCERGATGVFVALTSTVLLGFVGLVVDVGAVYVERRELQNGADAAALAVAVDCAADPARCVDARTTAADLLDRNASDGESHLTGARVDTHAGRVTVWARSKDAVSGALAVPMRFATLFGVRQKVVRATATAGWGPPRSLPRTPTGTEHPSLPLTIEACEFEHATGGGVTYERPVTILFHRGGPDDGHPCPTSASGLDAPGNFGWIRSTGACTAGITDIGLSDGKTGNSPPAACSPAEVADRVGTTVVLPVFESATGTGEHVRYEVTGWAAFHVTGFKLHGEPAWEHPRGAPPCSGGDRCIAGWFERITDARAPVGGKPFGISVIGLAETPDDLVTPPEPAGDGPSPDGGGRPGHGDTNTQEST